MKNEILEIIFSEFPTQKKKITTFFENSPGMEEDLDIFLDTYSNFMELENITPKKLAEAYIEMLNQMIFLLGHVCFLFSFFDYSLAF